MNNRNSILECFTLPDALVMLSIKERAKQGCDVRRIAIIKKILM
ncbi:hypothetical protein [Bartonella sp. AP58NXGY]